MPKPESSLATIWLIMFRLVELHGIDPQRFMRELGMAPETFRDVTARLPSHLGDTAFEKASYWASSVMASGKIMSAPASTQAEARSMAACKPSA